MKHVFAFIIALSLATACLGTEMDFSSMSTEEIYAVIDAARAEITDRKHDDDFVLVDHEGFQLTLSGKRELSKSKYLTLKGTLVNNSDENLHIKFDDSYVNGWKAFVMVSPSELAPHTKAKCEVTVSCEDIIKKIKQIDDILFVTHLFGDDYMSILVPSTRLTFSEGKIISADQEAE